MDGWRDQRMDRPTYRASYTNTRMHFAITLTILDDKKNGWRTDGQTKGQTDRRTDGPTDRASYRDVWTHLKNMGVDSVNVTGNR